MINFDDYTNENIIEHNSKWPYSRDIWPFLAHKWSDFCNF